VILVALFPAFAFSQVLTESSRPIGSGFQEIRRAQVSAPGVFEGISHFSFVYFGKLQVCQCSASEFFIAPSGHYALFVASPSGKVTVFNAVTQTATAVTQNFVGSINAVQWHEQTSEAVVSFWPAAAGAPAPSALRVSL